MKKIIFIIFFFLAIVVCLPTFKKLTRTGLYDWDNHLIYSEVARIIILEYKQFPLWNPWSCGGRSEIGHPENKFLSPFFLLILIFGSIPGYKIIFFTHLVLGLIGFYLLGKYYKMSTPASFLIACLYMFNGIFIIPFVFGMTNFLNIAMLPYLFLFFLKSLIKKKARYLFYCSLILTQIFLFGFHYLHIAVFLLFGLGIYYSIKHKNIAPLIKFLVILALFFSFSAVKLLPSIEMVLQNNPIRNDLPNDGYSIKTFLWALLSREQTATGYAYFKEHNKNLIGGQLWNSISRGLDENGMYIGAFPLILALWGIWKKRKEQIGLILLLMFFVWLSFGNNVVPGLFVITKKLPLLQYARVPQRFRYVFMIFFVLFTGFGFDNLAGTFKRIITNKLFSTFILIILIFLVVRDLIIVNTKALNQAFNIMPLIKEKSAVFTQHCVKPVSKHEYEYLLANQGVAQGCYESFNIRSKTACYGNSDYKGEIYTENGKDDVLLEKFSPNIIALNLKTINQTNIIVNQNYDRGWLAIVDNKKRSVDNRNGLISVLINPEERKLTLFYLPTTFIIGLFISSIACLLTAIRASRYFLYFKHD